MSKAVFDSSAIVTYLLQERPVWKAIGHVLVNDQVEAVLAGPALTEIIATVRRKGNRSSGAQIWEALSALGMVVEHPTERDLLRAAELIELADANPGPPNPRSGGRARLSLGDALILAITERLGCPVITGDTYWSWLVEAGLLDVKVHIP